MKEIIPFNKPYMTGMETIYITEAVNSGKISGNGAFTKKCQNYFEKQYGIKKTFLTTSCTDALEMCAILLDIKEGDEVIMPSYTFVSTANAFVLRGAKIVFADSRKDQPNIDEKGIEELITPRTKAIVVVHYAGVACEMDTIMALADKNGIYVVEDAAQAVDSFYKGKALGSIGHLSAFSFHETKNIISGEGGLLGINDAQFIDRAEVIWEKGTNRSAFFRGEIDKYGWVDVGSSFLPSDIIAAFLWAQIENIEDIQNRRKEIWNDYYTFFKNKAKINVPILPDYATNNAHMFYILLESLDEREKFIASYKEKGVNPVFHYVSLHSSPYYKDKHGDRELPNCDIYANTLVRMPMYYELNINKII
tara:strand:+ start:32152 stop:33243 length:1092 start_codon:yes stop_codon:yes gene_type:complete